MPLVSVLLPVYNAQAYLPAALDSVLRQTLTDLELIVVDDGSTDDSPALLARCAAQDARVRVHTQPNRGLVAALNRGLGLARGRYLARLDADDVCRPGRLARQAAYLDAHPDVGVCGSAVHLVGQPARAVWTYPLTDAALRATLLFETPFCHPAVMLRRAVLDQYGLAYNPDFREAEDYELWVRLAAHTRLANLPEVLLEYRVHPAQKRQRDAGAVAHYANIVRRAQLARLGLTPDEDTLRLHQQLGEGPALTDWADLARAEVWLRRLKDANRVSAAWPEPAFSQSLGERWFRACRSASPLGWRAWRAFWQSPLSRPAGLSVSRRAKFLLRCALRSTAP